MLALFGSLQVEKRKLRGNHKPLWVEILVFSNQRGFPQLMKTKYFDYMAYRDQI